MANADVELIVTLDVGPRVIRYGAPGGPNLFGESAEQLGKSGEPSWMPRGGHRLWTAPEDKTRTYAPDNRAVEHTVLSSDAKGVSVRFTQFIRANPGTCLLGACAVGFLVGKIASRR